MNTAVGSALWKALLFALQNERCLDLHYRERMDARVAAGLPNYKIMKQVALRGRLGLAYRPFIAAAVVAIPLLAIFHWVRALLGSFLGSARGKEASCHIVATTPTNTDLIRSAISEGQGAASVAGIDMAETGRMVARIGPTCVLRCIGAHSRLIAHILIREPGQRVDLLLHSRDAFALAVLTCYARIREGHRFATDDHYQRWAYLLSRNSSRLSIVQHGFLDRAIGFQNPFGQVSHLYVRDESFVPLFQSYYDLEKWSTFAPSHSLLGDSETRAIFLASSFPSVDAEIQFLRAIRKKSDAPIIVKLHPSHRYDQRGELLASLACEIVSGNAYPACAVFVSHSSFMEFDYRALAIPTVSIARSGGAEQASAEVVALLDAQSRHPSRKA